MKRRGFLRGGAALGAARLLDHSPMRLGAAEPKIRWVRLSSSRGELPVPGTSREQTGDVIGRFDKDSPATDFVLSFRVTGPALVWYRRTSTGWDRYVVEKEFLPLEAGGTAFDVDGDGHTDIVFGNDWQGGNVWWWENPYPDFDPDIPWKRHIIKEVGAHQHHDMLFADIAGTGKPQLIFWNQFAKTLFLAHIPKDPRNSGPWPLTPIFQGNAGEGVKSAALYAEGMDAFDIDGDGKVELLAGNNWFKHEGGDTFRPIRIGEIGGRIRAGRFKPGRYPQIVIAPGDGDGPLMIYDCQGDPAQEGSWQGRRLIYRDLIHGHTLDIGDIDGDGHLDILVGEQGKWTTKPNALDNPNATTWILYGNGDGTFRNTVLVEGEGFHDGRLADFDGDGDLDLLQKPYAWSTPRVDVWLNNGTGKVRHWKPKTASTVRPRLFKAPVGMELWTYRHELAKDLDGTLAEVRRLGFTDVETASFYKRPVDEFQSLLQKHGLRCASLIAEYKRLTDDLPGVIRDAKVLGAEYVFNSWIPHQNELTPEQVHQAARDFNQWGEALKGEGLQFGYHPHGYEFVHTPTATLFDVLMQETRPETLTIEMDAFWFAHGGADPVAYLEKYSGRIAILHLKDMAKGTARDLTGMAPDKTSVPLGSGELNWPAIFRAADRAGVKYYFIEDESPSAPQQVLEAKRYLSRLRY